MEKLNREEIIEIVKQDPSYRAGLIGIESGKERDLITVYQHKDEDTGGFYTTSLIAWLEERLPFGNGIYLHYNQSKKRVELKIIVHNVVQNNLNQKK